MFTKLEAYATALTFALLLALLVGAVLCNEIRGYHGAIEVLERDIDVLQKRQVEHAAIMHTFLLQRIEIVVTEGTPVYTRLPDE